MAIKQDVFILTPRNQVLFPALRASFQISPQAFAEVAAFCEKNDSSHIGVVAKKPSTADGVEDLHTVGTYCRIASNAHSAGKVNGKEVSFVTLTVEGLQRFEVLDYQQTEPHTVATIKLHQEKPDELQNNQVKALQQAVQTAVMELFQESPQSTAQGDVLLRSLAGTSKKTRWPASPSLLADTVAAGLGQMTLQERQQVLETFPLADRLQLVLELVKKAVEVQKMSKEISAKVQKRSEDELREVVLKRQLMALQKEMRRLKGKAGKRGDDDSEDRDGAGEGEEEEEEDEISVLREALRKAQMSPEAQKLAQRELKRLQNIQPQHPEYTVCRTYLETLSSLPWQVSSDDALDLSVANEILEKDHYGLDKVKRRILEFLAVQKMRGDMKGPILCLHGPPGVGKTSLGRSVAKALGRKFHRIALGGVRDESELRGHRRTYIGSLPGNIIQALISLKVNNPVILLDEIDKMTRNAHFNPSGAMLELLDPEQNHTFKDHYVNTPFDLSKVLFLCTCNDLNTIDRPLLDRMEVIELSGYTVEEKIHIATTHLLPKQRVLHALERPPPSTSVNPSFMEEAKGEIAPERLPEHPRLEVSQAAIQHLVTKWTMESGVRSLERRLAQLCRWAALRLAGEAPSLQATDDGQISEADRAATAALAECGPDAQGVLRVDAHHLPHIVGAELYEPDLAERLSVGVSMGLGVTSTGGQLLFVEASRSKGSGQLRVTGQLGEVMKESVSTAMSLLRSKIYNAKLRNTGGDRFTRVFKQFLESVDASKDPFGNDDIHVHFPAGAIPKDGPSAGITTTLALASLLLNKPVRDDTAVTGEITLRGHVLPVGGIRDKVLAAHRAGVAHVLLPYANLRHAKDELPSSLDGVELHFIKHIDEALAWAFGESDPPAEPAVPEDSAVVPPMATPDVVVFSNSKL